MKQNPKIKSLRASIEKTDKKIAELKEKRKGLQEELQKLENMDIVGLVRAQGLTLEELAALVQQLKDNPIPSGEEPGYEQEVTENET